MFETRMLWWSLLALSLIAANGCYATVSSDFEGRVYVRSAPPPPYVEVVGVAPGPAYVWVPGYWWWDGVGYVWIRGQWERPPRPGYVYIRSGWTRVNGHYHFVHGRWVEPRYRTRTVYVHGSPRVRVERNGRYRTVRPRGDVRVRQSRGRSSGRRRR